MTTLASAEEGHGPDAQFTAFVAARSTALLRMAYLLTGSLPDAVDDRDLVWRELAALGPRQRAVVVLRFYEDLTEPEIA